MKNIQRGSERLFVKNMKFSRAPKCLFIQECGETFSEAPRVFFLMWNLPRTFSFSRVPTYFSGIPTVFFLKVKHFRGPKFLFSCELKPPWGPKSIFKNVKHFGGTSTVFFLRMWNLLGDLNCLFFKNMEPSRGSNCLFFKWNLPKCILRIWNLLGAPTVFLRMWNFLGGPNCFFF